MGITPITGLSSNGISSVQPMNYAVSNEAGFSDVYAAESTKQAGMVQGTKPVQYPNATIEEIGSVDSVDPMEKLRENQKVTGQFNNIASKYVSTNVGYSRAGTAQGYGIEGSRLDVYA